LAVNCVGLRTCTVVAADVPNATLLTAVKFDPPIDTTVPPDVEPLDGVIDEIVGDATNEYLPLDVTDPTVVATATTTAPDAWDLVFALIVVELVTM
jgi:hypothetical protein